MLALTDPDAPNLVPINLVPLDAYADLKPSYLKIDIEGRGRRARRGTQGYQAEPSDVHRSPLHVRLLAILVSSGTPRAEL
jgi:hypothetical protein